MTLHGKLLVLSIFVALDLSATHSLAVHFASRGIPLSVLAISENNPFFAVGWSLLGLIPGSLLGAVGTSFLVAAVVYALKRKLGEADLSPVLLALLTVYLLISLLHIRMFLAVSLGWF